jgi:hypothetical protein
MSELKYNLIDVNGQGNITVVFEDEMYVANSEHPNWEKIVAGALAKDENVVTLFDTAKEIARRFERLSDRVSVSGGHVFFDGEEIDNSLTKQIIRVLDEKIEDVQPLVNFFEKVAVNPNEHSRTQLYRFLESHDITILPDGDILLYKGVQKKDDQWTSIHSGPAIVNGESVNGYVPQPLGAIVEMPRSQVQHDPSVTCHTGLHAGTFGYARSFSNGNVIKVKVNPRDVVSVPNDHSDQKVRVCRYTVLDVEIVPEAVASVYAAPDDLDYEDEDEYCDYCGDDNCYDDECLEPDEDEDDLDDEDPEDEDEPATVTVTSPNPNSLVNRVSPSWLNTGSRWGF